MLDYDNNAFYYFAITFLALYALPATYFAIAELFRAFFSRGDGVARTQTEKEKAEKLSKNSTGLGRLKRPMYLANLVGLILAWGLLFYLVSLVINDGEVSSFDPYTILGLESSATVSEIKKAYRKLSLIYHPDKNIGNKKAEEMFMKVAKAYEALTDEVSMMNYKLYGNPDGKQSLEVSIGLPKALLEHPKVVLILYLIGMVIAIPVAVGMWYSNSKQFGENNVKNITYQIIYHELVESHRVRNMPEILAASEECRSVFGKLKPENKECIAKLYGKLKNDKQMVKPKYEQDKVLNGNLLIHAHCLRLRDLVDKNLLDDLDAVLSGSPEIVEGIITIAQHRRWLETTIAAIRFSQHLIQALWVDNDPLQQLPHLTDSDIKKIKEFTAAVAANSSISSLSAFLQLSDSDKVKCLESLDQTARKEVLECSKLISNLSVATKLFVEEEEDGETDPAQDIKPTDIFEQDLVTLRVSVTRQNVSVGCNAGPVYAPHFPGVVKESLWLILTDKSRKGVNPTIHSIEKVADQSRVVSHDIKFMAPQQAGSYEMELQVVSDSYVGLEQVIPFSFTVRPASELPEYQPHEEDVALDNEPTLFEQMMAANVDDESSEDEDEAGHGKQQKITRKRHDSESEDEEDE